MSTILDIIAEDSADLLEAGAYGAGALIRVQSSATEAGVYADLTGTGSTPTIALVAGVRNYEAFDPNGSTTTWYRTRYENVGGTRLSDWSASFQAVGPPALCTVGQVKARLFPAGPTDENDDPLISELIVQVTSWIHGYTGRLFVPDDGATYTFDTTSGYVLRVPRGIRTVTSIGYASLSHQPDVGGTYTALTVADVLLRPLPIERAYGWPPTEIRLSRVSGRTFSTIENGVQITGDFGWASTPADIQAVCIDATVSAYATRKNGASGVIGAEDYALPPWAQFFSRGSPQRGTLDRYRHWEIG